MQEASRVVLDGFELRSDVEIVRYPDRYMDPRGAVMWERVMGLIGRQEVDEEASLQRTETRQFPDQNADTSGILYV